MLGRIRTLIADQISQHIKQKDVYHRLEVPTRKSQAASNQSFNISLELILNCRESSKLFTVLPNIRFNSDLIQGVHLHPPTDKTPARCEFFLEPQFFLEEILHHAPTPKTKEAGLQSKIVVEFSSPNIAKPFHVGHLRSTIIGNVLSNLHRYFGYQVTNLNYLGDWGTQLGLLQVGMEMTIPSDEQMRRNPIECLYRAYVAANAAAETDLNVAAKARQYFSELESDRSSDLKIQWQKYREYTKAELAQVYARLGVSFDYYDWESQYSQSNIVEILNQLKEKSLLFESDDGRKVVKVDGRFVPVVKSDGTSLYLARDIAALVDRLQRFSFDRILYIVENAQTDHFNAFFKTSAALSTDLPLEKMTHVKFGRIHGMSTRKGTAIFLRDLLDEARDMVLERQSKTSTTRVTVDDTEVSDILGISAVIINDLKQRRQRDYDFDWNKALQMTGDTGIKLQYTHCRLSNLLKNVSSVEVTNVLPSVAHLMEPEAQDLIKQIARFEQTIWKAKDQLEACILVNYLFVLCNSTSRALKRLNVKHEHCLIKQQNRILLFRAAKEILAKGMTILGLTPLTKM